MSYNFAGSARVAMRVQVNGSTDQVYYLLTDHLQEQDMIKNIRSFMLLIAVFMLAGCNSTSLVPDTSKALPTSTQKTLMWIPTDTTVSHTLIPAVTPRPSPSFTSEPFPNQSGTYPSDILLGLLSGNRDLCDRRNRDEIWLTTYPYATFLPLFADAAKDYRFPQWSPDGNWIAYVESNSSLIREEDLNNFPVITGTEAVWIMSPNGLERHMVSESVPSAIIEHLMGNNLACDNYTQIAFPPQWSPDGKYISFVTEENMGQKYSYYLTEVDSGPTRLLLTQEKGSDIVWMSDDRFFLEGEKGQFHQVAIETIDNIVITTSHFSFPNEIELNIRNMFLPSQKEDTIIALFFLGSTTTSPKPKQISVWEFNILNVQWTKLVDLQKETWAIPESGNRWITWCDTEKREIALLDPLTWKIERTLSLSLLMDIQCNLEETIDSYGDDRIFVLGTTAEVKIGIWIVKLQEDFIAPDLFLDLSGLVTKSGSEMYIENYSFRP